MFDKHNFEKMAQGMASKLWGLLLGLGTFTSGLLGIYVVFRVLKCLVKVAINAFALHKAFGFGL